jgi:hypothetical protein
MSSEGQTAQLAAGLMREPWRRIALDLLRADASLKASLKGRRKTAAWDDAYMARLLRG